MPTGWRTSDDGYLAFDARVHAHRRNRQLHARLRHDRPHHAARVGAAERTRAASRLPAAEPHHAAHLADRGRSGLLRTFRRGAARDRRHGGVGLAGPQRAARPAEGEPAARDGQAGRGARAAGVSRRPSGHHARTWRDRPADRPRRRRGRLRGAHRRARRFGHDREADRQPDHLYVWLARLFRAVRRAADRRRSRAARRGQSHLGRHRAASPVGLRRRRRAAHRADVRHGGRQRRGQLHRVRRRRHRPDQDVAVSRRAVPEIGPAARGADRFQRAGPADLGAVSAQSPHPGQAEGVRRLARGPVRADSDAAGQTRLNPRGAAPLRATQRSIARRPDSGSSD
ncbi:hypothetical protein F01_530184 [Burkholderia cenocepacia]|nr:hypothetical protein F01_530184 [Burkholderia cenocepacia]